MRIISRAKLKEFYERHADSKDALEAWFAEAKAADWTTPNVVKAEYPFASIINSTRVVFNICGNKYRLVVAVNYSIGIVYIRFIGTHPAYDKIDPATV